MFLWEAFFNIKTNSAAFIKLKFLVTSNKPLSVIFLEPVSLIMIKKIVL